MERVDEAADVQVGGDVRADVEAAVEIGVVGVAAAVGAKEPFSVLVGLLPLLLLLLFLLLSLSLLRMRYRQMW